MSRNRISFDLPLLVAALVLHGGARAAGAEFPPNIMFVASSSSGDVLGFDPSGETVFEVDVGASQSASTGIAFGADGLLYVAHPKTNRVAVYDSAGVLLEEIGAGSGMKAPGGLAFGPNGHLYVSSTDKSAVFEFDTDGNLVREITDSLLLKPRDVAIAPDGHVYVSSHLMNCVLEFDPFGTRVRVIQTGIDFWGPTGLALGPNGHLYVAAADWSFLSDEEDVVCEFDASGSLVAMIGTGLGMNECAGIAIGPDGHLFVSSKDLNRVFEFDVNGQLVGPIGEDSTLGQPEFIAFSPFRFRATVRGTLTQSGKAFSKLTEKDAVLSVTPGSGAIRLRMTDDPADALDLATCLGSKSLDFRGFEAFGDGAAKKRRFHGSSFESFGLAGGFSSILLEAKGKVDSAGRFRVKSAAGTLHRASPEGVLLAEVTTTKLLK